MPIPRVNTNSNYHLLMLWENQKASNCLHLKSLFLRQRSLKNREKFQKKNKKPRKRERKRKLDGERERERERERRRRRIRRWRWSSSSQISPRPRQSNFSPSAHSLFLLPNLSWFYVDISFVLFFDWSVLVILSSFCFQSMIGHCLGAIGGLEAIAKAQLEVKNAEIVAGGRWEWRRNIFLFPVRYAFTDRNPIFPPESDISPTPWPVEPAYGSSSFFGWTPVRSVLSQLTDTQFYMLKKPDFNPVSGFFGQTVRSGPDFKTMLFKSYIK